MLVISKAQYAEFFEGGKGDLLFRLLYIGGATIPEAGCFSRENYAKKHG